MTVQSDSKLHKLLEALPEGLLVDSTWLRKKGYSTSLCSQYVAAGWLERPVGRVYRRASGKLTGGLTWQQVVISVQEVLGYPLIVGGRTAIELQGFAHYVSNEVREVHLYGRTTPPTWLANLDVGVRFIHHSGKRIFRNDPVTRGLTSVDWNILRHEGSNNDPSRAHINSTEWGPFNWPLTLSTIERAVLEVLDQLPNNESFHQVDKLMEGMATLSPRRLQRLLSDCHSVKVKRLFFFFAERHNHRWLKQLSPENYDLGTGNRSLVKGGRLDSKYHITVPEDLDGLS